MEQGMERGVALSEDGMEQAGMGIGIGDLSIKGALDIVKTHFAADTPAVYTNDGKGEFQDDTLRSGLGVETRFISWGVGIEDFDNDGMQDIFWVTGGIYPELQDRPDQPYARTANSFPESGRGTVRRTGEDVVPTIAEFHCSRGCAFGDFDNDGDIDMLVINLNEPPSLLRNDVTGGGHWIKIKLKGVKSNRSAIGARYRDLPAESQTRAVLAQSSYLSVNDRRLHFGLGEGLGEATLVDIDIHWPSGEHEALKQVPADRLIYITEGRGIVRTSIFRT